MGYTTYFEGAIQIDRELDNKTYELLIGLSNTRRMKRNIEGYGIEGEFYIESIDQDKDDTVIDTNNPPLTQPGVWLDWIPSEDRKNIIWNGSEKFYHGAEWMIYLIDKILAPRGYVLNGKIKAQGECANDRWNLIVKNNKVKVKVK